MTIVLTLVMKIPPNFYFVFNFWRLLLLFEDLRGGAGMINGYPAVRLELFHQRGVIIYTNMGLDPLTMMDWYCMDNDDSLYLSGCQSTKQRHALCI